MGEILGEVMPGFLSGNSDLGEVWNISGVKSGLKSGFIHGWRELVTARGAVGLSLVREWFGRRLAESGR